MRGRHTEAQNDTYASVHTHTSMHIYTQEIPIHRDPQRPR